MTKQTRLVLAGTAAALVAAVSLVGGALRDSGGSAPALPVKAPAAGESFAAGFSGGDTASFVRRLVDELRLSPRRGRRATRCSGSPTSSAPARRKPRVLHESEQALDRARKARPARFGDGERPRIARSGPAQVPPTRSVFGRESVRLAPYTARNYGVVGDALIELGRYDEAFRTFDHMSSLRPDLSSYSRVSYARELLGRPNAANQAMTLALDAAGGQPEPTAWVETQLGKLAWSHGRIGRGGVALPHCALGLSRLPLRARAARARPRRRGATTAPCSRSRDARPTGFRFRRQSRRSATCTRGTVIVAPQQRQYALVDVIRRLLAANGVRTDLEIAQFDADHGVRLGRALAAARHARRARPSIDGDDVLGAGARAERPLRRGAPLLSARASTRHTRRAQVLPPRNDRALPWTPSRVRGS